MKYVWGLVIVLFLSGCTAQFSAGDTTNYMEKGTDHIAEKDYVQAAIYFERAMQEGESEEAEAYFHQTSDMTEAVKAYDAEQFEEALTMLDFVLGQKGGSETIKSDARTVSENAETWLAFEKEIEEALQASGEHLEAGRISEASDALHTAEAATETYSELSSYTGEVSLMKSDIQTAADERREKQKREEERRLAEQEAEEAQSEPQTTVSLPVSEQSEKESGSQKEGYKTYENGRYEFSFEYPPFLKKGVPPANDDGITMQGDGFHLRADGGHAIDGKSIEDFYREQLASLGEVAYQQLSDGWYVLSYKQGTDIVYKKFLMNGGTFNTFELTYDASRQEEFESVVEHIGDTFSTKLFD